MKNLLQFSIIFILLTSCIKDIPDPSWVKIETWTLEANPNAQNSAGVLTHNFTDARVYVNNELLGIFELPVKIPVLAEGNAEIKIFPTIKNNGISATKKAYPFVETYVENVVLVKNQTVTIHPKTRYYKETKFNIEDFEDVTVKLVDGPNSSTNFMVVSDASIINPQINENKFLKVVLNQSQDNWVASTTFNNGSINMPLPKGQEVYLEIDYYNTNQVVSGLLGIGIDGVQENPNVRLNPQSPSEVKWKKIYIELREVVSGMTNAQYYEFSFDALLDDGDSEGIICIDNIKAVYF